METQRNKPVGERRSFIVRVFADEYNKVNINSDMVLSEAQTIIRAKLDLPARQKEGSIKSKVRNALKDADDETIQKALKVLQKK